MRKWKKLKRASLENGNCQEAATGDALQKKLFLNWIKLGKYNSVLSLFTSFLHYYICILSRSSRLVFFKKVFLKISQNSQENTCTAVSFLRAASNFNNEETPVQCFPKPLTIFTKSFIVDVWLGYTYASVLPCDLKLINKDLLLRRSLIKIATVYYHD